MCQSEISQSHYHGCDSVTNTLFCNSLNHTLNEQLWHFLCYFITSHLCSLAAEGGSGTRTAQPQDFTPYERQSLIVSLPDLKQKRVLLLKCAPVFGNKLKAAGGGMDCNSEKGGLFLCLLRWVRSRYVFVCDSTLFNGFQGFCFNLGKYLMTIRQ